MRPIPFTRSTFAVSATGGLREHLPIARNRMSAEQPLDLGRIYLRLLRRTFLRIERLSAGLIEPHGLTNAQFLALLLIRDNEGLSQVELTGELDSDQNTVSALVRRMAARGLVSRTPHPTDRRAVRLVVTEAGAALVNQTLADVDRLSLKLAALTPAAHKEAIASWLDQIASLEKLD